MTLLADRQNPSPVTEGLLQISVMHIIFTIDLSVIKEGTLK
jgi:hypothetical protein